MVNPCLTRSLTCFKRVLWRVCQYLTQQTTGLKQSWKSEMIKVSDMINSLKYVSSIIVDCTGKCSFCLHFVLQGKCVYHEDLNAYHSTRTEIRQLTRDLKKMGVQYMGLCCGGQSHYFRFDPSLQIKISSPEHRFENIFPFSQTAYISTPLPHHSFW